MNDLIVAALMFLGVASSPSQVTDNMVTENRIEVEATIDDPDFIQYYEVVKPTIGNVDTWEGD